MKIGITLDDKLVKRIDDYADSHYMSRSGFIAMASTQLLNYEDVMDAVRNISEAMKVIKETGSIDEEVQKKLDDFERVAQFIAQR